jgi:hypothetical protein
MIGRPSRLTMNRRERRRSAAPAVLRLEPLEIRDLLSTCTVTGLGDQGAGAGLQGDLRYCVTLANSNGEPGNQIVFQTGLAGTIALTQGPLTVGKNLQIAGPGMSALTISGSHLSGVFNLPPQFRAGNLDLSDLSIADGTGVPYGSGRKGGGIFNWAARLALTRVAVTGNSVGTTSGGEGGGIYNVLGSVALTDSVVSHNQAYSGGGISNASQGQLVLSGSTVADNTATYGAGVANNGSALFDHSSVTGNVSTQFGGGISNIGSVTLVRSTLASNQGKGGAGIQTANGQVTLTDSTVADNLSPGSSGGGILQQNGSLDVSRSTISGNRGYSGGGVYTSGGNAAISNSTLSGNVAEFSGGALFAATGATFVELTAVTITHNRSLGTDQFFAGGGGILVGGGSSAARVLPRSTIVAGNTAFVAGPDVKGAVISLGYNLVGKTDDSSGWTAQDLQGTSSAPVDPKLGPLKDNGGPTPTHAVLAGSPAIQKGDPALNFTFDQRYTPRAYVSAPDVGAFEAQPAVAFRLGAPTQVTAGVPFPLVVTALDSYGNTASTYTGTIHFTSTDPAAVLPPNYQFVASDGGKQVFSVTLQTPGLQKVSVYDTGNINRKGTVTVDVVEGLGPAAADGTGESLIADEGWLSGRPRRRARRA